MKANARARNGATEIDTRAETRECQLTLVELAYLVGTNPEVVEEMLRLDLIEPCLQTPEPCFPVDVLPRVRRMLRLCRHVGLDLNSMGMVLDLLDRVEALERELQQERRRRAR